MDLTLHHRFHPDVRAVRREGTRITLDVAQWRPLAFTAPTAALADAVCALGEGGGTLEALVAVAARGAEPERAAARVAYYLERFRRARLVEWAVRRDGEDLLVVQALTGGFGLAEGPVPAGALTLSRFAYVRRDGGALVLESPETPCRAWLRGDAPEALRWIADGGREAPPAPVAALLEALWRAGFLEPAGAPEAADRATWEFHDRLFHVATRGGRDAVVLGGTYRFKGRFPAPPAIKPPMSADRIVLPPPDPAAVTGRSDRLAAIMDRRRSTRDYGEPPITLDQLGELLFRVARVTKTIRGEEQELLARPFPSGGAIHETEFYAAVRACQGLDPAIYHYSGRDHALERLPGTAGGAARLCGDAALAMAQADRPPQVVVVLTSRLPRLAWKYQGLAYRLTLLHAGIIVQTLYLVATDMGLAACATGSGDARLFAEATGLDPFVETSVAEFALGAAAAPAR